MVSIPFSSGLDISCKLFDQAVQPEEIGFELLVLFFRQKDIVIFSKG